ncbi:patatin-like phospholipase family protein [Variovorax sp. LT1P1]|uniref:patatin-like phospholipase family protein n=1 Tax=Variovorax sp. LT1P1 TaxID=3443730 RepID=UPI003F4783CA
MPKLNLALQGGGAHGAFTWGALDRLLEEPDIEIGRISGTSAGALNGAALASGWATGGREGARRQLAALWHRVATAGIPFTWLLLPLRKPSLGIWDDGAPLVSPYVANPLGMAPLRLILGSLVDEGALKSTAAPELFVNAVNVHTGENKVFGPGEVTIDALLASACAPLVFQAVSIEGASYWDGSYGANPTLRPLFKEQREVDLMLIELVPLVRPEIPMTAKNILNRINEVVSINALKSELREVQDRNAQGHQVIRMHVVSLSTAGSESEIEPSIKRSVGLELFESLRATGWAACDQWLNAHRDHLGVKSTADVDALYLGRTSAPPA